ncbi:hypothetical protein NQ317_008234 [Molorchus minor]|uniref:ARC105/Med15 mediator subunit central domain-containing protein n=1 Tax=Molorchus minor TaxID=1323400 RepID=A0ABQ9J3K9_9CUCU|nr:hypothetical protein NQ317_008234 [Molorchus minor]
MSDTEYSKKLETLQHYIPFLDNMILQLKDPSKKNREQQLTKIQSLHAMITDKKKKWKLETLVKCEDVISKLYEKVHNRPITSLRRNVDSPTLTPASPSPPRDVLVSKPLTIPTERLESDRPKIDIYTSAAESLRNQRFKDTPIIGKLPDMSRPPISLEDLKTLEDDVQDKINESSLMSSSLLDLNNLKQKLTEQIHLEEVKLKSPQKKRCTRKHHG